MKPHLQISHEPKSIRGEASRSTFPITDFHYLGTPAEPRGHRIDLKTAASVPAPAFHELSNEFIESELKRHYVAEAAAFAIIVAVSAWPIASVVSALSQLK